MYVQYIEIKSEPSLFVYWNHDKQQYGKERKKSENDMKHMKIKIYTKQLKPQIQH